MTWRTHVLAGTSAAWLLEAIPGSLMLDNLGLVLVAAAFGALLPDLDAGQSKVRTLGFGGIQPFVPLSSVIHGAWGHRGPLHSVFGLSLVALLVILIIPWVSWQVGFALWLGYASHLAADACTRSGIPLLQSRTRVHLLPSPLRFQTGSQAEEMLLPFLAAATAVLVFKHLVP